MTEVVIDAHDPDLLASFWSRVLGWGVTSRSDYEVEIGPPAEESAGPTLVFLRSADVKTGKVRIHLDLRPTDRHHDEELARLLEIGAAPADIGQGDVPWAVLADPEGNEFCLLHPVEAVDTKSPDR